MQPSAKRAKLSSTTSSLASASAAPPAVDPTVSSPSQRFLSHLLLVSTAQIASHSDFTYARRSVLSALSEVAMKYVESIGIASSSSAVMAGRSEVNAHDILFGLSEMGVSFSEMREWGAKSSHESLPFQNALPPFPSLQPVRIVEPALIPGIDPITTRPAHIPACLPSFPPKRMYTATPDMPHIAASLNQDASQARKRKMDENRKLEGALVSLHQAATQAALQMAIEAEKEMKFPALPQPAPAPVAVAAPAAQPSAAAAATRPTVRFNNNIATTTLTTPTPAAATPSFTLPAATPLASPASSVSSSPPPGPATSSSPTPTTSATSATPVPSTSTAVAPATTADAIMPMEIDEKPSSGAPQPKVESTPTAAAASTTPPTTEPSIKTEPGAETKVDTPAVGAATTSSATTTAAPVAEMKSEPASDATMTDASSVVPPQ